MIPDPPRHPRAPAEVPRLVAALAARDVRYVVSGSVAARLHGLALRPNDLDVVPDLDPRNLARLFDVLRDIEATPDGFGHWVTEGGRRRWIAEETTPERLATWAPDAADLRSFDHLFRSRHGDFDVVPELTGGYAALASSAVRKVVHGTPVWVAGIDDLVATLEIARRPKHAGQIEALRALQARANTSRRDP
jgi:hypothetical protein